MGGGKDDGNINEGKSIKLLNLVSLYKLCVCISPPKRPMGLFSGFYDIATEG